MTLGTRRATAAKAYIVDHGVESSQVIIESKGERHPLTDAPGIAGQAPNRRAVFRIVMQGLACYRWTSIFLVATS